MEYTELKAAQDMYKVAVGKWVDAIRAEEDMACVDPSIAQVDQWEGAHFREEELRANAAAAKEIYGDILRRNLFEF